MIKVTRTSNGTEESPSVDADAEGDVMISNGVGVKADTSETVEISQVRQRTGSEKVSQYRD